MKLVYELRYVDGCAEGTKSVSCKLEVLLSEGDADDGEAKDKTKNGVDEPSDCTAEAKPKSVLNGSLLKVGLNGLAEGSESKACELDASYAEGDKNDGRTKSDTEHEVKDGADKAAEDEPNDVAKSFHSFLLMFFLK